MTGVQAHSIGQSNQNHNGGHHKKCKLYTYASENKKEQNLKKKKRNTDGQLPLTESLKTKNIHLDHPMDQGRHKHYNIHHQRSPMVQQIAPQPHDQPIRLWRAMTTAGAIHYLQNHQIPYR